MGPSLPALTSWHTVTWTRCIVSLRLEGENKASLTALPKDDTKFYGLVLSQHSLVHREVLQHLLSFRRFLIESLQLILTFVRQAGSKFYS